MDRFQEMQAFTAVVDAGSFVGAAEALGLSKAAVSRQIADLEARLAVRLLHRTTRKLSLTDEGEVFYARCRELLGDLAEAEAELSARSGQAVGALKVSAPVSFGLMYLAPVWAGFMAAQPQVKLDVTLSDRMVDLVDEGFDIAVRVARLPSSSLVSRKLSSTRMVLCASPAYLQAHGTPRRPSELAQHQVLAYTLMANGDSWEFQGPQGPVVVKVAPRMHSNSGDTCVAAALGHQGLVLQPTFLIADALRSGALVEVMPQYRAMELGIYALYPTRKHVVPKVRLLIDHLVQAFEQKAWPD
jgi:DNA-binding transcriptional LysR family regulator